MTSPAVDTLIPSDLQNLIQKQRILFNSGQTQPVEFRLVQLQKLKQAVLAYTDRIVAAARQDLGRSEYEAYFEIATIGELDLICKQLRAWVKPRRVSPGINLLPASAWIQPEPLGLVLIIGPWNFPFQLMISPLTGAIAAGNCAILKPSELAPHTSQVMAEMIGETFDPAYVAAIQGGVEVSQMLLQEKFDHIFFTGGTRVGKIVMAAAAKHLTPVTLELGGKNPCIVDTHIPIDLTARRIAWGKFTNAGQTCIAPDYLLVHRQIKSDLLRALQQAIVDFFGEDPAQSPDFSRIINTHHLHRLQQVLGSGQILMGGKVNPEERYIAPTLLDQVSWEDPIMEEEIFGPILPILEYEDLEEVIPQIKARPKPLSIYLFSQDPHKQSQVLEQTSSGGVCLNDTLLQVACWNLPFGGVGESGIGAYHGKKSFETLSHYKSVLKKPFWLDATWRYAPYGRKVDLIKRIVGL